MRQIQIGEILVQSEEGDSFDELLKVVKKAKKIYIDSIKDLETSCIKKLLRKII